MNQSNSPKCMRHRGKCLVHFGEWCFMALNVLVRYIPWQRPGQFTTKDIWQKLPRIWFVIVQNFSKQDTRTLDRHPLLPAEVRKLGLNRVESSFQVSFLKEAKIERSAKFEGNAQKIVLGRSVSVRLYLRKPLQSTIFQLITNCRI